jgi:hypothetical protein
MIRLILRRDPQQRPTVAQLCAHPWISAGNDFADADLPEYAGLASVSAWPWCPWIEPFAKRLNLAESTEFGFNEVT